MNKSASPLNQKQKSQVQAPQSLPEYKSNPFAVSFKGFELLVEYAKGIFIALIVLGVFSLLGNIGQVFLDNQPAPEPVENTQQCLYINQEDCQDEFTTSEATDSFNFEPGQIALIVLIVLGVLVFVVVIGAAIEAAITGTIAAGAMSAINKKHITFGRCISAMGDRFGVLFVASILAGLKIIGGYLLFIVPGIRAQFRYEAVPYIIMSNPNMTAKEALAEAKTTYDGHLMEMFGITFVEGLIPVIGSAFGAGGRAMSYQQLKAYRQANVATPKAHWLNYLPFLFIIAVSVLIFLIALLVISFN